MNILNFQFNKISIMILLLLVLNQCGMGADARKYPPEPSKRVAKNLEEGRGITLMGGIKGKKTSNKTLNNNFNKSIIKE